MVKKSEFNEKIRSIVNSSASRLVILDNNCSGLRRSTFDADKIRNAKI